ncbi:hypothetical protein QBC45DRAFT_112450 [Copromyces sp. CBS 386.78]|nr:hypothetical protein QBC45DRAFT_112450 [Copromyces sp. CBS 386.78]
MMPSTNRLDCCVASTFSARLPDIMRPGATNERTDRRLLLLSLDNMERPHCDILHVPMPFVAHVFMIMMLIMVKRKPGSSTKRIPILDEVRQTKSSHQRHVTCRLSSSSFFSCFLELFHASFAYLTYVLHET